MNIFLTSIWSFSLRSTGLCVLCCLLPYGCSTGYMRESRYAILFAIILLYAVLGAFVSNFSKHFVLLWFYLLRDYSFSGLSIRFVYSSRMGRVR